MSWWLRLSLGLLTYIAVSPTVSIGHQIEGGGGGDLHKAQTSNISFLPFLVLTQCGNKISLFNSVGILSWIIWGKIQDKHSMLMVVLMNLI